VSLSSSGKKNKPNRNHRDAGYDLREVMSPKIESLIATAVKTSKPTFGMSFRVELYRREIVHF
jgi:hypothetical protein